MIANGFHVPSLGHHSNIQSEVRLYIVDDRLPVEFVAINLF